ncbi:hypothetical protein TH61_05480 [Rufibacter sp. DG15C]|uniref:hypothetical protein n=1 Tax=Rufibacter sp. DG15C TaxID=1379909 RepID=UPI00078E22EC|nr:hypothetical protein [Rufibacter sp. DG15C]AMM50739.1 hypothetical protein TH61_05480 [Rufibacter sp. DG15C]
MVHVLLDSFLISLIHALIPSHWMALVAIGRSEGWPLATTLRATLLAGLAHITGTLLLGGLVGYLGIRLSEKFTSFAQNFTPLGLVLIGIFLLGIAYSHSDRVPGDLPPGRKAPSVRSWFATMTVALFFSPCFEISSYFLTAATHGWRGILLVAMVFVFVTLPLMLGLVALGYRGIGRLKGVVLERHGHAIMGGVLIVLGLATFFYE